MGFKLPGSDSSNDVVKFVANTANPDPTVGWKYTADKAKSDVSPPKPPGPTQAQLDLERQQRETMTMLDDQENKRRKRLLNAMQGMRAFTGSALFRSQPTASRAAAAAATTSGSSAAAGGSGATPGYGRVFDPGAGNASILP